MSSRDGHLGDFAAGLVDGALSGSLRDQALAHVAGCDRCRADLDDQRRMRDQLQQLEQPALPPGLQQRLLDIATAAATPDPRVIAEAGRAGGSTPSASGPGAGRRADRSLRPPAQSSAKLLAKESTVTTRPGPGSPSAPSRGRRTRRLAGGVTALAMGVAVVVVTLGPGRDPGPAVTPAVFRYTVEHAQTTGGFPGADPAAGAVMSATSDR